MSLQKTSNHKGFYQPPKVETFGPEITPMTLNEHVFRPAVLDIAESLRPVQSNELIGKTALLDLEFTD